MITMIMMADYDETMMIMMDCDERWCVWNTETTIKSRWQNQWWKGDKIGIELLDSYTINMFVRIIY